MAENNFAVGLFGAVGVGKTSISIQYVQHKFNEEHDPTIEDYFEVKKQFKDVTGTANLVIYDTAGQDNYQSVVPQYLRNAEGIILVYSVTDASGLKRIEDLHKKLLLTKESKDLSLVPVILVANKCDLPDREVSTEQGQKLAQQFGIPYLETSAKLRKNIDEAFELLISEILKKRKAKTQKPATQTTATAAHKDSPSKQEKEKGQCNMQ